MSLGRLRGAGRRRVLRGASRAERAGDAADAVAGIGLVHAPELDETFDRHLRVDVDDDQHVHALIEWESLDQWKAIPHDELAAVDEAMGPWVRACTCRTFEVIRDC